MKQLFMSTAALILLFGCTTPGTRVPFQNSAVINKSEDQVWSNLIAYFTSNNIQIRTIERDSGVIYAERMTLGAILEPEVASCNIEPLLIVVDSSASVNVFVQAISPTQTQVTVNMQLQETGAYGAQRFPIPCYSTGAMEAAVLQAAGAQVTFVQREAVPAQ